MANFKNITDLPVAESAEGLNLIVNDNGSAKQIAADKIGGGKLSDFENDLFYSKKELFLELNRDDFVRYTSDSGYDSLIYKGSPKLDWFTSADSFVVECSGTTSKGETFSFSSDMKDTIVNFESYVDNGHRYAVYHGVFDPSSTAHTLILASGVDPLIEGAPTPKDEFTIMIGETLDLIYETIALKIYRFVKKKIPAECTESAVLNVTLVVPDFWMANATEADMQFSHSYAEMKEVYDRGGLVVCRMREQGNADWELFGWTEEWVKVGIMSFVDIDGTGHMVFAPSGQYNVMLYYINEDEQKGFLNDV